MLVIDPVSQRQRRIGIAWICLTTLMFALLDASAKWLVQVFPVFQVIWMRFLVHTVLTAALFGPKVGHDLYRVKHPKLQLIRGLMLATMTALNFFALQPGCTEHQVCKREDRKQNLVSPILAIPLYGWV